MRQPPIIIIINKKPYTISAGNIDVIRTIPTAERQQLIAMLEAIKQQEQPEPSLQATSAATNEGSAPGNQDVMPKPSGSGDVDAMMAQLIMEENLKQKSSTAKQSTVKWIVIIFSVIFLLALIL